MKTSLNKPTRNFNEVENDVSCKITESKITVCSVFILN